jgi:hypothetical protein
MVTDYKASLPGVNAEPKTGMRKRTVNGPDGHPASYIIFDYVYIGANENEISFQSSLMGERMILASSPSVNGWADITRPYVSTSVLLV